MFTLHNILGVAQSAIAAHQVAVQVSSHNISNAQTEGYSRQRLSLHAGVPVRTAFGPAATGVRIAGFERMRDGLLDQNYRRDVGKSASFEVRRDLMQRVENIFGEPSDTGISSALDAFWSAWSDLANDPLSDSARGMVRQRGMQVVSVFHHADAELTTVERHAKDQLAVNVGELNRLGKSIAGLNTQIVAQEAGGGTASDLRDSRDLLLDKMARLGTTRVTENSDGSVSVQLENTLFVDAGDSKALQVGASGSLVTVGLSSGGTLTFPSEGSALGEMLNVINVEIPDARTKLDKLAEEVVQEVNDVHTQGPSGNRFFDPGPPATATAGTIVLSGAVEASASAIEAGKSTSPSDNSLALEMAELRTKGNTVTVGAATYSFGGFYRDLVAGIALKVRSAEDSSTVYETLAAKTDARRASVSGVSIDEELIQLMQHQQAYVAATRVVTAVDEMMRDLLGMIR